MVSGETAVYIGHDTTTDKPVTIREFFVPGLMHRRANGEITILPGREVLYKSLVSDFEELNRSIMTMDNLNGMVSPLDFVAANNTVYAIDPFVESPTLDDYLAQRGENLGWLALKKALTPMIMAIVRMHADGIIHRGISPETVFVDKSGDFLLTGLSIPPARTMGSEVPGNLFFGYSAPEQYYSTSWQGSWTDVYSLAALCYRALTGSTPVEFRQRGKGRPLVPPRTLEPRIPENISNVLMVALSVDLSNRYRTVEEFWSALLHGPGDATAVYRLPIAKRRYILQNKKMVWLLWIAGGLLTVAVIFMLSTGVLRILIGPIEQEGQQSSISSEVGLMSSAPVESPTDMAEKQVVTPDLIGMSLEKILIDPLFKQMFVFEPRFVYSETTSVGDVLSQQPAPGEVIEDEEIIVLIVSKGSQRVPMPDVVGLPIDSAKAILKDSDIEFEIILQSDESHVMGIVLETTPPAGSMLFKTSEKATLIVSEPIPPAA
jgi:serine/threonine-protein kinase